MRSILVLSFAALVWIAAWSQQAPTLHEYTFEASRQGATAVDSPGPFSYPDFIRLLVRRAGPFRLEVTRDLRERPAPELDLWSVDLPEVLKLQVGEGKLEVIQKPTRLRLGVDTLYNLPVLIRNEATQPIDVKVIGRLGEDGPTDRFPARPGVSYFSLNWRPRSKGSATATVKLYAGMRLPEGNSPPESTLAREISFPVDVVGWGGLRVKTNQPARVYVAGSDGLSYAPAGALARITWSSGDYFYYTRGEDEIWLPEGRASIE
ncbi:MAG: hypothetical protein HY238_27460, partial [Acidobacteria bacterium]|nr:hypothetical protein [Acidobacteriota bacterium]